VDPIISSGGGHGSGADGPHHPQHKSDNAFWNFTKFQHPLQRDHSFHSVGKSIITNLLLNQTPEIPLVKKCFFFPQNKNS